MLSAATAQAQTPDAGAPAPQEPERGPSSSTPAATDQPAAAEGGSPETQPPPTAAPQPEPAAPAAPAQPEPAAPAAPVQPTPTAPVLEPSAQNAATPSEPARPVASDAAAPNGVYGAHARASRVGPAELTLHGTGSLVNAPLEEQAASVSVVDGRAMQERGALALEQALNLVPGITPVWTYGGFLYLTMRGFQAITLVDGFRDTRAMVAGSAPQGALLDLDRVEVLRGPSSMLYGYGAVGGAVNLIRHQPSRTPQYLLEYGLGLPDQQVIHTAAQGPLGPMFSYRVDLGRVTRTDFRGATTERNQATSSVSFTPTRDQQLTLRLAYEFDHYNTDVGIPTVEDPDKPGTWGLPHGARLNARYNTKNDFLDYQRLELAANYRADLSRATYLQARFDVVRDYYDYLASESLTYVPAVDMTPAAVDRDYLHFARGWTPMVGQLELHSEATTGPIRQQFVLGAEINSFTGKSDRGDTGDAVPGQVDFAYPEDAAAPTHTLQRTSQDHYRYLAVSFYAFDHVHLLPELIVTGGLRYDTVRSRVRRVFYDRYTGDSTGDPMTGQSRPALKENLGALTGQIGAVYTPVEPFALYVGYSTAFKPNFVYPSDPEAHGYDPERSQQVEAGVRIRARRHGHVFDADAAVYYIEKRNMLSSRGADEYDQAGKVTSRGLDVALRYSAPHVVSIDANYSYTNARFDEFISPDPVTGADRSLAGKHPEFTPRHGAQVWLRLAVTEQVGFGVGGRFIADQFGDQENRLALPNYALLDLSAWFRGERVSFILSARNVLDHHDYFTSAINSYALNPQLTPGPGREVLGTLRLTL